MAEPGDEVADNQLGVKRWNALGERQGGCLSVRIAATAPAAICACTGGHATRSRENSMCSKATRQSAKTSTRLFPVFASFGSRVVRRIIFSAHW